jgi:electron transfer DM13
VKQRKLIVGGIVIAAGAIGWALFRPDTLFVDKTINESFPGTTTAQAASGNGQPTLLSQGSFHSGAHKTDGMAAIYQLADGKRTLRLTNFATSNGPAVHVYLVAANDATDNGTVKTAGFIDLGPIKGNKGDQNYDVPLSVDLTKYRSVTIWCARFGVNFGTAPLSQAQATADSGQPAVVASGSFHSGAHRTEGRAAIYKLPDGTQTLRLTRFETSNGPAVHVYLVAAADAKDNATVKQAGFIDLGDLKGNKGDQNYNLPANTDLGRYRAVTIWCARFGVNFGTAPLALQQS